jgi:hypothetical protein
MLKRFTLSLILSLLPALLSAQGSLIPRSCARICPADGPCMPCRGGDPSVVKQSSHVRADLVDRVIRYEVTETFVNRGGRVGEADYIFPLPRGAAFQDLKLSIDGQMVAGETMNAQQARGIYEEIVRRQRDPALVEWMGYGMLRARIFPINPGEVKKVVVRFQMVAEREGDALRVDYFQGRQTGGNAFAFVRDRDEDDRESRSSYHMGPHILRRIRFPLQHAAGVVKCTLKEARAKLRFSFRSGSRASRRSLFSLMLREMRTASH